jgi:hypothetical protein
MINNSSRDYRYNLVNNQSMYIIIPRAYRPTEGGERACNSRERACNSRERACNSHPAM